MTQDLIFDGFRKRDRSVVPFDVSKIQTAMWKASWEIFRRETGIPAKLLPLVIDKLKETVKPLKDGRYIPTLNQVQDVTLIVLNEEGHKEIARAYADFRNDRDKARKAIKVRSKNKNKADVTDKNLLLVESGMDPVTSVWDRSRIVGRLSGINSLTDIERSVIAKIVENRIIASGMTLLTSALIREMLNTVLAERGHKDVLKGDDGVFVPDEYVNSLLDTKCNENSNLSNNNPEAVSLAISELVLKEWALTNVFSEDVKRAHLSGAVHLHDLGFPHRVYCSAHSVEFVKKYGLVGLDNLNSESKPAKSASVLTGHLNTFIASMQAYYAGALGLGYVNIFYAPYLVGMNDRELKQIAQELIFNGSQNAFSRGASSVFLDFNVHPNVPENLKNVPVIGPGGKYKGILSDSTVVDLEESYKEGLMTLTYKGETVLEEQLKGDTITYKKSDDVISEEPLCRIARSSDLAGGTWGDFRNQVRKVLKYGDFEEETRRFAKALLEVWSEGDKNGRIFVFPKCNFHVDQNTLRQKESREVFDAACRLAAKNGSTYFIFDRDAVTLAACCRLRTTIDDKRMLSHPELLSFCGFQNVTVNIPQAAYRASLKGKGLDLFLKELDDTMELAMKAHLQKQKVIKEFMKTPGRPLYQVGKIWAHGRPYIDIDKATYIIGTIGVNDAVKFITGKEMHESDEALDLSLKIIAHMYLKTKEFADRYGLKVTLEETPAESAARRLARTDLALYNEQATGTVKGPANAEYYTNSIHLTAEADVGIVERIRKQSMFHSLIESGAIIHAFVGEERPSAEVIANLIERVYNETQSAQVVISPEFTYCNSCYTEFAGLKDKCPKCGSLNVDGISRVVGYYSIIRNWNRSKAEGELKARQGGKYSVG